MENPNCCDVWDQRIPNEPLYERNFLIQHPPVIHRNYPRNTDQCVMEDRKTQPWLLLDPALEQESANYWCGNLKRCENQGVPTVDAPFDRCNMPHKKLAKKHTDRPWVHGVNYNIDVNSQLKRLDYYNPKDCIVKSRELNRLNQEANLKLLKAMQPYNFYPNVTPQMFQNPTRMVNLEPIGFDYEQYLHDCCPN
jgi:hypothetical protein